MSRCLPAVVALIVSGFATMVVAGDAYYDVRIRDLTLTDGTLPTQPGQPNWRTRQRAWAMLPWAVIDGEGEAYVRFAGGRFNPFASASETAESGILAIRAPERRRVTGRLFFPNPDWDAMVGLRFEVPASKASPDYRKGFYEAKLAHYERLLNRGAAGAAWFRHQAREARIALNREADDSRPRAVFGRRRTTELADTFALFTGGRAMSENLQLDRVLPDTKRDQPTVKIDSITGITVQEIDWKELIKDLSPKLDPLASKIPFDQHVVFFPTFTAAVKMRDEAIEQGATVLRLAEPRSEDARTLQRYERQMCLSLDLAARLIGPQAAKSVALTGSDPYYRTGTDVAVLFETANPALLENMLLARVELAAGQDDEARPLTGEVNGVAYRGVRTPDRSLSCYVATLDGAVVVTNSLYQLRRLVDVEKGKWASIASLPEYTFFRNRYPLGDPGETAFLFLSDATIRRWCGPRWRIATSRRTRDMAVIAEMQASHLDRLVKGAVQPGPIYTDLPIAGAGELRLRPTGVSSSVHGSLGFMTPIAEISLDRVSEREAEAYRQWRDWYQRNWRWSFDPIGLRLGVLPDKLAADLTVMPLIWGTEYRRFIGIAQGAVIAPDAGDLHSAPAHFILALNTSSPAFRQGSNLVATIAQGVTLGWLGQSVALYADDDPFWKELAEVTTADEREEFFEKQFHRLPIAVRAEVSNGLKLAAFLAALRAFIEQTAPGMTQWESLTYKDQAYVRITPSEQTKSRGPDALSQLAVYYAPAADSLTVTLNEKVLHRAIDRQLARGKAEAAGKQAEPAGKPWLGSSMGAQVDKRVLKVLAALSAEQYQIAMQVRAWGNLPILNEWKRRYPDRDPLALHERVWGVRLVCPGGGEYVWNEKWQTMESTVYGHPGRPKRGPVAPPALGSFSHGNFGLTFEEQGLRAKVILKRD